MSRFTWLRRLPLLLLFGMELFPKSRKEWERERVVGGEGGGGLRSIILGACDAWEELFRGENPLMPRENPSSSSGIRTGENRLTTSNFGRFVTVPTGAV